MGNDTRASEAAFRDFLIQHEAILLEPRWLGVMKPHRIRCRYGHEVSPTPKTALKAKIFCRVCARRDPQGAWAEFKARVSELGGKVVETQWLGSQTPHRLVCAAGHECAPRPSGVAGGQGICNACAGNDSGYAWNQFRDLVAELGGVVLESEWLGNNRPHRVRCSEGHIVMSRPNGVQRRRHICAPCSKGTHAAEIDFRAKLAAVGGTLLEAKWLGSNTPHRVMCDAGHITRRTPQVVRRGSKCRLCGRSRRDWDVFYVVADDKEGIVKFGVTSGDPRPRLGAHRASGLDRVVRLLTNLPIDVAPDLERATKAALRLARERPLRGREYFGAHVLGTVLDIVDNYPIPR